MERAFSRAYALCQQAGESPQLFPVLWGLWRFYFIGGKHRTALELGEQCLSLAQTVQDAALLIPSHLALGGSFFMMGNFGLARTHLEQGIALYDPRQHRALAFRYGIDFKIWCLSYKAWPLWMLGHPDQALRYGHEALRLARELAHPLSLTGALAYLAWLHQLRHESADILEHAKDAVALAREHGFPQYEALGTIILGWALARQGQSKEGVASIRQGMFNNQGVGAGITWPWFLAMLAEAGRDEPQAGLQALDDALSLVDANQEHWWEAEVYRLKGELLLNTDGGMRHAALTPEDCFQRALDVARQQHAKSLELRAATSLARLWQSQGKRQEAYELLAPVYGWFTEGFDTADLKEAKALLEAWT